MDTRFLVDGKLKLAFLESRKVMAVLTFRLTFRPDFSMGVLTFS